MVHLPGNSTRYNRFFVPCQYHDKAFWENGLQGNSRQMRHSVKRDQHTIRQTWQKIPLSIHVNFTARI